LLLQQQRRTVVVEVVTLTVQQTDRFDRMYGRYDVVVVGGGPAGLSAALALGRARRSVLVVDAGAPRNAPAGHVHNYLGREGVAPVDLLAAGRAEVALYGGSVVTGTVTSAERVGSAGADDGFRVTLEGGQAVLARRLLVATGLVDELPAVPGVAERWGRDVLHCPYCHGWEVRDQALGILGTGPMAVHQALLFRQWSPDVTLFLHTAPDPTKEQWEQLAARGIEVVDSEVAALEVTDDRLSGVRLRSGQVFPRQAVVIAPTFTARSDLLTTLGVSAAEERVGDYVLGSAVPADATGATGVPGVWVAGNVTDLRGQVIGSAAAGLNTGAAVNADLVAEETRRAVAARRERNDPRATVAKAFSAQAERDNSERVLGQRRHGLATLLDRGAAPSPSPAPRSRAESRPQQTDPAPGDDAAIRAGLYSAEFWDGRYRSNGMVWSGQPNAQLVAETTGLAAGRALDVGSGEGADALWLAERGWQVTGVDVSRVALDRSAAQAAQLGADIAGRLTWRHEDLLTWSPPSHAYDLVTVQFMHLPTAAMQALVRRLAASVEPCGTLLVVGHAPTDEHTAGMAAQFPDIFFTAEQVVAALDPQQWKILVAESRPRPTGHHSGPDAVRHDTVVRAEVFG